MKALAKALLAMTPCRVVRRARGSRISAIDQARRGACVPAASPALAALLYGFQGYACEIAAAVGFATRVCPWL